MAAPPSGMTLLLAIPQTLLRTSSEDDSEPKVFTRGLYNKAGFGCKTSTSSLTPDFQYYKVFLPGFIITVTEAGYVHDKRSADLESTSNNQSHLHKTALLVL